MEQLALSGIILTDQRTLLNANVEQNETHTVLTFTKFVEEEGELAINPTGDNFFLVAAGSTNELAYHAVRQPFPVALGCAPAEAVLPDIIAEDEPPEDTPPPGDLIVQAVSFLLSASLAPSSLQ